MFQFITISNGVAVVQHCATGHVYRFRPRNAGVWTKLALDRIDVCHSAVDAAEPSEAAALSFAEEATSACCLSATESVTSVQRSTPGHTLADRLRRLAFPG